MTVRLLLVSVPRKGKKGGSVLAVMSCSCGNRLGTRDVNGWLVCRICLLPVRGDAMGIVLFDGGPLNGKAFETKDLLGGPALNLPLKGYVWTSEKRKSVKTGAIASVWKFEDNGPMPDGGQPWVPQGPSPDETSPIPPETGEPGVRPEPGDEEGDFESDQAAYGSAMRARRDAIRATRAVVCARTGFKPSRLYAIEMGTGKPITGPERKTLEAAIEELEGARGRDASG